MPLPAPIRKLTPDKLRHSERLRSVALGAGLIPPRPMHTTGESNLLEQLASRPGVKTVVELGTYEGSSAVIFCRVLPPEATLHVVDSYEGNALLFGWQGTEKATKKVLARESKKHNGPQLRFHIKRTDVAARDYDGPPIDVLFIDADHTEEGCRADWDNWHGHVAENGAVAFHDARASQPDGGHAWPGPTAVVDSLFRGENKLENWVIEAETDTMVAVRRVN
jgi:predicted O-methyltransferase YrrM